MLCETVQGSGILREREWNKSDDEKEEDSGGAASSHSESLRGENLAGILARKGGCLALLETASVGGERVNIRGGCERSQGLEPGRRVKRSGLS